MTVSLFVYGTLEIPEVLFAVTGRDFPATPAVLPGHGRWLLRDRTYPGIVRDARSEVAGVLYGGVDRESLALLDLFESDIYERRTVRVLTHEQQPANAEAYVVLPARHALLTAAPWSRAAFVAEHLADFIPGCRAFRADAARRLGLAPART